MHHERFKNGYVKYTKEGEKHNIFLLDNTASQYRQGNQVCRRSWPQVLNCSTLSKRNKDIYIDIIKQDQWPHFNVLNNQLFNQKLTTLYKNKGSSITFHLKYWRQTLKPLLPSDLLQFTYFFVTYDDNHWPTFSSLIILTKPLKSKLKIFNPKRKSIL